MNAELDQPSYLSQHSKTPVGIVIECDHRDSDHLCLKNISIAINGIRNENLKTLQLERESANVWRHKDPVELLVPLNFFFETFYCESDLNHEQ